jgi:dTDP-4-dehydrorhamnose 3,5-epimerase
LAVQFTQTGIDGAWVIDPSPHLDDRGYFQRVWCSQEFAAHDIDFVPVQANMGLNRIKGTLRGMHFQDASAPEIKLVRCTRGSIYDVVLDRRPDSPTYGRWFGTELSATNGRALLVPALCAHGYQTLEDESEIHYLTSAFYTPSAERGLRFDDPVFAIRWPMPATALSVNDRGWPLTVRPEAQER